MNCIKKVGQAYALQATHLLKSGECKFVGGGEPPRLANLYCIALEGLILVFDDDRVPNGDRTQIIVAGAGAENVLGAAGFSKVQQSVNGYQINLPSAVVESVGFRVGGKTSYVGTDGLVIISQGSSDNRRVRALLADRAAQAGVGEDM